MWHVVQEIRWDLNLSTASTIGYLSASYNHTLIAGLLFTVEEIEFGTLTHQAWISMLLSPSGSWIGALTGETASGTVSIVSTRIP